MNYLIIRTPLSRKYALRIANELRAMGNRCYIAKANLDSINLAFDKNPRWNPDNLIIHSRAAHPFSCSWMNKLIELEIDGYRIVNKSGVLGLTSDKYQFIKFLENQGHTELPRTYIRKSPHIDIRTELTILKPRVSSGGGKFVERVTTSELDLSRINAGTIIQEFIPYHNIYRVFVIGGRALPILTVDSLTSERWKVSVCLNKEQRPILNILPGHKEIMEYAENIQREIAGEINFIDVFSTGNGLVLSEINTACSLLTHERITGYNISREIARYLNSLK